MESSDDINFKKLLKDSFKKKDKLDFSSGSEGKAFFVEQNYVLKCYELFVRDDFRLNLLQDRFLLQYGKEVKHFKELGFCYPEIYAYDLIYQDGKKYFCVLQQKLDGRRIFFDVPKRAYALCEDFLSREDFNTIFEYGRVDGASYEDIMERYIRDFIVMNERFLSLPESAIENYIMSVFGILKNSRISFPDLSSGNVIMGKDTLSIIDNSMLNSPNYFLSDDEIKESTMQIIARFFTACASVNEYKKTCLPPRYSRNFFADKIIPLVDQNKMLSKQAIERLFEVANKCLENPKISPIIKDEIREYTLIHAIGDKDLANEVCEQIHER